MIVSFLLASLMAAPTNTKPKIIGTSMFKNGYAVVMREIDAPHSGEYFIDDIPQATLGTVWFSTTAGTKLDSVVNTTVDTSTSIPVDSLDAILRANAGKKLSLSIQKGDGKLDAVTGKLISATGQIVVIQGEKVLAINKGNIISISAASGQLLLANPAKGSKHALRLRIEQSKPGKIFMISMERGPTWAPGYAVELLDDTHLSVTMKATLLNDLGPLDDIECRFITGFPNIAFINMWDPLTAPQTVDSFTATLSSAAFGAPAGPGGFGGGGGRRGDMMSQNGATRDEMKDFSAAMTPSNIPGLQAEDLFFYRQPNVTLKRGDRAFYILFKMEAECQHLYTLDLGDIVGDNGEVRPTNTEPLDVWHALKFKNTSGRPFTTAAATTFKKGEILGQDMMHYVTPGADAEVRITKALDIRADSNEEEVGRERGALKNIYSQPTYDLVTLKGTIELQNRKPEKIKIRIVKDYTGEIISTEGEPKIVKNAKGLRDVNPHGKLTWMQDLEPGKSVNLTYSYKLYVPAR